MQELLYPPIHERSPRTHKRIGDTCLRSSDLYIELDRRHLNNDPLAHVKLLLREGKSQATDQRIRDEVMTDLAERSPDDHFLATFEYRLTHDDLVTPQGVSLKSVYGNGIEAACRDGISYGMQRAEALAAQLPLILSWALGNSRDSLVFFSLCPDSAEVDYQTAKKLNFKPERMMSSNWLFEKTASGIRMHAFSLDGHTMAKHQQLLADLDLPQSAPTTLLEVTSPYILSDEDGVHSLQRIRRAFDGDRGTYFGIHGSSESANDRVDRAPETLAYYNNLTESLAWALYKGRVTRDLRHFTKDLQKGFRGFDAPVGLLNRRLFRRFHIEEAAEFIEYVRSRVLPHYIYAAAQGVRTFSESGAAAFSSGVMYEGACPTSDMKSARDRQQEERRLLEFFLLGRRPVREKEFTSAYCPCCLPKPEKDTVVKAWMGEGFIGCDDCGHIVDICGEVYEQGQPSRRRKKASPKKSSSTR